MCEDRKAIQQSPSSLRKIWTASCFHLVIRTHSPRSSKLPVLLNFYSLSNPTHLVYCFATDTSLILETFSNIHTCTRATIYNILSILHRHQNTILKPYSSPFPAASLTYVSFATYSFVKYKTSHEMTYQVMIIIIPNQFIFYNDGFS